MIFLWTMLAACGMEVQTTGGSDTETMLQGRVLDHKGAPIAGVSVKRIAPQTMPEPSPFFNDPVAEETQTNAEGYWVFTQLKGDSLTQSWNVQITDSLGNRSALLLRKTASEDTLSHTLQKSRTLFIALHESEWIYSQGELDSARASFDGSDLAVLCGPEKVAMTLVPQDLQLLRLRSAKVDTTFRIPLTGDTLNILVKERSLEFN